MKLGLVAMLLVAAAVTAQTPKNATAAGQAGTVATGSPAVRVYTNPELHLTFSYPAELAPEDGAAVAAVGRRMIYADTDSDPDHPKADTCTKVLLSVGKGSEGSGGGKGAWARVGLLEVSAGCFPPKVFRDKKATDAVLRNLVTLGTTVMGMMPLEQPGSLCDTGTSGRLLRGAGAAGDGERFAGRGRATARSGGGGGSGAGGELGD